jgi:hypothetical protein
VDEGTVHDALVIVISVLATLVAAIWIQPRIERWRAVRNERRAAELATDNQKYAARIEAFASDGELLQRYLWHTAFGLIWDLGLMVGATAVVTLFLGAAQVGTLSQVTAVFAGGGVGILGIDVARQAVKTRITLRAVNAAIGRKTGRQLESIQ